jgi:mRNA interferase RelE/StbE
VYDVRLARRAERALRVVRAGDPSGYRRILAALRDLAVEPRRVGSKKLTTFDPPAWRIRVGDYRIVYEIDDTHVVVVVVNAGPRSEVYR